MSIYSVAWERGYEDGEQIGKQIGEQIGKQIGEQIGKQIGKQMGEQRKLLEIICNMLRKGNSPETIADILGENIKQIDDFLNVAETFAPGYEFQKVLSAWMNDSNS